MRRTSQSVHTSTKKSVKKIRENGVLNHPFEIFSQSSILEKLNKDRNENNIQRDSVIIRTLPFIKNFSNITEPNNGMQQRTPFRKSMKGIPNDLVVENQSQQQLNNAAIMSQTKIRFFVEHLGKNLYKSSASQYFQNKDEIIQSKANSLPKQTSLFYSLSPTLTPLGTTASNFRSTSSNFEFFQSRNKHLSNEEDIQSPTYQRKNGEELERVNPLQKNSKETNQIPYESQILEVGDFDSNRNEINNNKNNEQVNEKQFFENFMHEDTPIFSNNVPVLSESQIQSNYPFQTTFDMQFLENQNSSLSFLNGFPHNFPFVMKQIKAAQNCRDEIIKMKEDLKEEIDYMKAEYYKEIEDIQFLSKKKQAEIQLKIKEDFVVHQNLQFDLTKQTVKLLKEKCKLEDEIEQALNKTRKLQEKLYGQEIFNIEPRFQTFKNITQNNLRSDTFSQYQNQGKNCLTKDIIH